uniref:DUF3615 domain-containing protein n=1 Tax=Triticum urartu TaxID=4572 RepID=A0A8R7TT66_TRIUA
KPLAFHKSHEPERLVVQALVDQYNEDHNLSGDLSYELKDLLCNQFFISENERYIHYNFSIETKGVDGFDRRTDYLFFAEGKLLQGKHHQEMVVSCIRIVEPNDNGHCYGCKNTGSIDLKHRNEADACSGGHVNGYSPVGGHPMRQDDVDSLS